MWRFNIMQSFERGLTSGPRGPGGPGGPGKHPGVTGFCFPCSSPPKTLGSKMLIPSFHQTYRKSVSIHLFRNKMYSCRQVCADVSVFGYTYGAAPLPQLRGWREQGRWRWGHEATGIKPQWLVQHLESWETDSMKHQQSAMMWCIIIMQHMFLCYVTVCLKMWWPEYWKSKLKKK